ncbi:MAG: hypothetical protein ACHP8B_03920 [Terriglobales bacterium]
MKLPRIIAAFLLLLVPAAATELTDQTWYEVTSPNFIVISNAGEKHAREAARQLEEFRAVFQRGFPSFRMSAAAPTVVLAVKDENTMHELAPWFWEQGSVRPVGLFVAHWETNYALLRLDLADSSEVIFHEYVHQLERLNFIGLPAWVNEGLAEYYGNTKIESDEVKLGLPSPRLRLLREHAPIPVEELLTQRSSHSQGDFQAQIFYAECWALTHMLIAGPGMGNGEKMDQFLKQLQGRSDQLAAFRQVFGEPGQIDQQLQHYIRQYAIAAMRMKNPPKVEEGAFASRALKADEVAADLAGFEASAHGGKQAQHWLDLALQQKPGPAAAHRVQGFRSFGEGKDNDALSEFALASSLDPKDYLSAYYAAMLRRQNAKNANPDAELAQALKQVRALNPSFAPAHVELSRVYMSLKQPEMALAAAKYAADMEPGRAGYHLNVARILLQQGQAAESAITARYVAQRWYGTDRDQALEIWREALAHNSPPAPGTAPSNVAPAIDVLSDAPQGSSEASGVVKSVHCGDSGTLELTLQADNHSEEFVRKKGAPLEVGFEDTLWFGDHFNVCHRLEGQRAVIHYKPAASKDAANELVRLRACDSTGTH